MIVQAFIRQAIGAGTVTSVTATNASITIGGTVTNPTVGLPYKVYRALLTQIAGGVPTAVILENTLGEIPTFAYNGTGNYSLSVVANLFLAAKTFVLTNSTPSFTDLDHLSFFKAVRSGNTSVDLATFTIFGNGGGNAAMPTVADDVLRSTEIQILVYN